MIDEPISSGDAAKFETVGDTVKIVVTNIEKRAATKFQSTEPLLTRAGAQVYEYVFSGVTDDGDEKRIFAKLGMWYAIKDALKEAGMTNLNELPGSTLAVRFSGEEPSEMKGYRPRKVFKAQVQRAPVAALSEEIF